MGCTVTQRIRQVRQPSGGYVNPGMMTATRLGDGIESLNPQESISPSLMGTGVDYMTRFLTGASLKDAFSVCVQGARVMDTATGGSIHMDAVRRLLGQVRDVDDQSLTCALRACVYNNVFRGGLDEFVPIDSIQPDGTTLANMRTMIHRSQHFFDVYGPRVLDGFTFEGGYTATVTNGDGDFTTRDTLWDFKTSRKPPTSADTLQILMYWLMGLHSFHPEFQALDHLGIYNPRLNTVYRIATNDISATVITAVEEDVIGYEGTLQKKLDALVKEMEMREAHNAGK